MDTKAAYINSREQLDEFISRGKHSRFIQSWAWGEFQNKNKATIFRLGAEENGELVIAGTIIVKRLGGGYCYLYCPRGPVIREEVGRNKNELFRLFFSEMEQLARKEKAIFLRFEPDKDIKARCRELRTKYKINKTIDIQPPRTLILDLMTDQKELLTKMHPKTRYNIRLAEKKGVKVRRGKGSDFGRFWELMQETVKRDVFRLHPKSYYLNMLSTEGIRLYVAEYKGMIIAANILSFFGDTVTYLHGSSANGERQVMAPFLLQWRVIEEARTAGYRYYDFYGIDEKRWPGVTRFKLGFGGYRFEYPGTFDLLFSRVGYNVYWLARKIRRSI
ncbi:MAG: peptidoglycan bridge formation glycyltransferase FemA/FemB family protein [Planctomycetes bacterium]|jgi:lipid II:glycine glycyltransferase (peptidoglycan interpeptide bridge formation enzyme)|nr:peptidoglycan bridge formation glycyltransferase FemA/FemB family protein [Planctomycetota bacterium]